MKKIPQKSVESAFLGIGTGKRVAAKAAAAKLAEEEKRKTMQLEAELKAKGYKTTEEQKAEAEVTAATIDAQSSQSMYYIIGGVIIAVMIGLYFIVKK